MIVMCGKHILCDICVPYRIAGNFRGGGAKFRYFRGPVSGTKIKTHENVNLCTMAKCEVFEPRN